MKSVIVTICACLLVMSAMAQEKFTVPSLTDQQKYNAAAWQWNGAYVILIKYARSLGQTVEEAAIEAGGIAAATWDSNMTFDDLVNNMLYTYVVMTPSGKVEIIEQSPDSVAFSITNFYKPLDGMLDAFEITRAELSKFYAIYAKQIADVIGAKYVVIETGDITTVTVSKN